MARVHRSDRSFLSKFLPEFQDFSIEFARGFVILGKGNLLNDWPETEAGDTFVILALI